MEKTESRGVVESKPISGRTASVYVEYDCRGERKRRLFTNAYKARQFYCTKDKCGKHPAVIKVK
jgi:hypothetical protein